MIEIGYHRLSSHGKPHVFSPLSYYTKEPTDLTYVKPQVISRHVFPTLLPTSILALCLSLSHRRHIVTSSYAFFIYSHPPNFPFPFPLNSTFPRIPNAPIFFGRGRRDEKKGRDKRGARTVRMVRSHLITPPSRPFPSPCSTYVDLCSRHTPFCPLLFFESTSFASFTSCDT